MRFAGLTLGAILIANHREPPIRGIAREGFAAMFDMERQLVLTACLPGHLPKTAAGR